MFSEIWLGFAITYNIPKVDMARTPGGFFFIAIFIHNDPERRKDNS